MARDETGTKCHPVDAHVGQRLRMRRKMLGLSQETLASTLGISFQQIQKYERGTNRISASKLFHTANALGVAMTFFYEGLPEPDPCRVAGAINTIRSGALTHFLSTSEGMELAALFPRIRNPKARRHVLALCKSMADEPQPDALSARAA